MDRLSVALIHVPSPFLIWDKGAPPLGLLYLAAALKESGAVNVQVVDLAGNADVADFYVNKLWCDAHGISTLPEADVYGIYAVTPQYPFAVSVLGHIRSHGPRGAKVMIGGPHASAAPRETAADGWDFVVEGEADLEIGGLVANAVALSEAGNIHRCTAPPDLDSLLFPAREMIDLLSYMPRIDGVSVGPRTTLIASRGCPYACAFCCRDDIKGGNRNLQAPRSYRWRSGAGLRMEIDHLAACFGVRQGVFVDDIFSLRMDQLAEYRDALVGSGFRYRCNTRAHLMTEERARLMAESGCEEISFGLESADDNVLKSISKNTVEGNRRAVGLTTQYGMRVRIYFIFGFPGDGPDSAQAMKDFVLETKPDSAQVATLIPLPGSALGRHAASLGWHPPLERLYHNGRGRVGGIDGYPWLPAEKFVPLREDLLQFMDDYDREKGSRIPQREVECSIADMLHGGIKA